ncbi:hypothetical protein [Crenobacter cavernae]|uniref:DUF5666 domain-containing protein n=1 Tax=Crenobacter cavernae TaxID=2290923 RepID=A0A345Y3Z5_9NEIS|nr:hypothetical protein [Crenobacter cavernae]AXK38647.1 hypothetical protein DWG20_03950 [Crenobacter cavernae]
MTQFVKLATAVLFALTASGATLAAEPAKAQHAPKGVLEIGVKQAVFNVEAVDPNTRLVTLGDEAGNKRVVAVGDDVKNLDKLKVGQKVRITGSEALLVTLNASGNASTVKQVIEKTSQTANPAKPNLRLERTVTTAVTVDAIDLKKHTVTVRNRTGELERLRVRDPLLKSRLKHLKAGAALDVVYRRAVAVKLLPQG